MARADFKEYRDILTSDVAVKTDLEFAEIKKAEAKKQSEFVRKRNKDAYIDSLLFISTDHETGRVAFQIICTAKTKEFSGDDVRAAWRHLESKFESKRAPSRLIVKEKLMSSKSKILKSNPDVWITQLEDLQVQITVPSLIVSLRTI